MIKMFILRHNRIKLETNIKKTWINFPEYLLTAQGEGTGQLMLHWELKRVL